MVTDQQALLKDTYFDAITTIRHYDGQRASFTQLVLSALTVIAGFTVVSSKPDSSLTLLKALSVLGFMLSCSGILVTAKLNNLIKQQRLRAKLAVELFEIGGDPVIQKIDATVKERNSLSLLGNLSLNSIWSGVFVIFLVANVLLFLSPETIVTPGSPN